MVARAKPYTHRAREVYRTWLKEETYRPDNWTEELTWVARNQKEAGDNKAYLALEDKNEHDYKYLMEEALGKQSPQDVDLFTWRHLALSFMNVNPTKKAKLELPLWLKEERFQIVYKSIDAQLRQMRCHEKGFPRIVKEAHHKEEEDFDVGTGSELEVSVTTCHDSQMGSDTGWAPVSPLPSDINYGMFMSASPDGDRRMSTSASSDAGPGSEYTAGSEASGQLNDSFSAWVNDPLETTSLSIAQLQEVQLLSPRLEPFSSSVPDPMCLDESHSEALTIRTADFFDPEHPIPLGGAEHTADVQDMLRRGFPEDPAMGSFGEDYATSLEGEYACNIEGNDLSAGNTYDTDTDDVLTFLKFDE